MDAPLKATILVPAYNEEAVIGRTLQSLTAGMAPGEFQLIVICNACHDGTADAARAAAPEAMVLETDTPGKTNAMNIGRAQAASELIVCLDADLSVSVDHIRRLIAPLQTGLAHAACGRMDVDLTGCSLLVRMFYAIWMLNPYFSKGKFGGLFAMSGKGANRVFPLPDIIADDEFTSRNFSAVEKAFVPDCRFTVHAPRSVGDLMKIRRRSLRGTRQIAELGLSAERATGAGSLKQIILSALARPVLWPSLPVYICLMVLIRTQVRLEAADTAPRWERDNSSRIAPLESGAGK
jgi:cellulose synthase/poly-beta-1,6-N-acetylglucosamine synthase-like glycosyltransferase